MDRMKFIVSADVKFQMIISVTRVSGTHVHGKEHYIRDVCLLHALFNIYIFCSKQKNMKMKRHLSG